MFREDEDLVPETPMPCPEEGCSGTLRRRKSKHGYFYGCDQWPDTRCPGSIGCHSDGRPLGIPANQETRRMRQMAHHFFDKLWENWPAGRSEMYKEMGQAMGIEDLHIANLDFQQCERLIDLSYRRLKRRRGPTVTFHSSGDDGDPEELLLLQCECGRRFFVDAAHRGRIYCPYCGEIGKIEEEVDYDLWP